MNKLLNEIAEIHGRVGWKGYTVEDLRDYGPLVVGANDITSDNQIDLSNAKHLTREKYEESPEIYLQKDDILVVKVGSTIGKVGIINKDIGEASINPNCVIVRATDINPYYLYYYMCSPSGKTYLLNNSSASGQPALNQKDLGNMPIPIVDTEKQECISSIFNLINNKIANNNRISVELESLAKTIYDYWFLQFEFPNEEGKPYKSSGGKMVYNEELKREIPEGWEIRSIKDCIEHINTGLNPRDNFVLNDKEEVKYITVKNLTTEGTLDFSGCDYISFKTKELVNRRSQIKKGDILFASIAPLGRCYLIEETPEDWEINESVFSIRPDLNTISAEYLYMFFMSDWFIKKAEHSSTGSVFSGIRVSVLEDTKILVPDEVTTKRFFEKASSIMNAKFNKEKENQQLTSLRDWLLPMLMNGQVKFKDA